MFNKLKFNNIVITNKKIIQQGRSQVINKLVNKLKKLQYLLDKNQDNIKNKNRMRKNVAYLEHLKKLNRLQIIKNVLLLDKNPATIITNDRAAPEEIVIAMLATNKLITDLVKKIRDELNLTSQDNSWKEKLMENSKRQTKMEKVEYRRAKRKDIKDQKTVERKRKAWLEENNDNKINDNHYKKLNMTSRSGIWLEEELDYDGGEELKTEISTNELKSKESEATFVLQNKKESANAEQLDRDKKVTKTVKRNKIEKLNEANLEVKRNENVNIKTVQKNLDNKTEISAYNEYNNEDFEVIEHTIQNDLHGKVKDAYVTPHENLNTNKIAFVEDPFFITETGKPYMSTAVITNKKQNITENELNNTSNFDTKTKADKNKYQNETQNFHKTKETNSKWKNKGNQVNNSQVNYSDNLHPSWAAKQKLKPVIKNFQGKKITFNDDDNMQQTVPKNNFNEKTNGIDKIKFSNKIENDLHPSWAAKQKQKPSITAFEGKKIKFDDDDS